MEEDRALEISNLQVRIAMLRREEREWLAVLSVDSQGSRNHTKARLELRRIMEELRADAAVIKKLESELGT